MSKIKEILIGTNNTGKYKEIKDLLPKEIRKYSPKDFKIDTPEETGKSFEENSKIKALYLADTYGGFNTNNVPIQLHKFYTEFNKYKSNIQFGFHRNYSCLYQNGIKNQPLMNQYHTNHKLDTIRDHHHINTFPYFHMQNNSEIDHL